MRQLVRNMVIGVSEGYKKVLTIIGVGYKAEMQKNVLVLSLGYANDIEFIVPEGIKISLESPTKIIVEGIDKQQVGEIAAEIRSLRKPEPYKGKGVRYENEYVRAKSGKAGRA
jgi:large subunit ribosomal protein L6